MKGRKFYGLIVLALLLTFAIAYRSLDLSTQHGRLSVPPLYDDVGYFFEALTWLKASSGQSLASDVWRLLHTHAPMSTLVAAIGLRVFPQGYLGPYLVHAAIVFAFLLGIIWLIRNRPASEIATCLIAAVCVPMLWHTISEARPDLPWGLAIGMAVGAVVYRGVLQRSARSLVVLGAACALAVGAKPTAFPASLALLASVFAIRLAVDWIETPAPRASMWKAMIALAWFSLGLIAMTAVLIGPALIQVIAYILDTLVYRRDVWDSRGSESLWAGLQHFSVGLEGQVAFHDWLWVGLALMLVRLPLAAARGRGAVHDAIVVLAALLIAYVIPSVAAIKTYFFGAIFYGIFIVAMALNYCAIQASLEEFIGRRILNPPTRRHLLAGLRAVPLAVATLVFVKSIVIGDVTIVTIMSAQQQESIRLGTEHLWSLLKGMQTSSPAKGTVVFSSPYPVTPRTIDLYALQADMRIPIKHEFLHRTVDETEQALLRSDILVISSSIPHNLVGPRVGDELIRRLDANKDVCLLDSVTYPDVTLRVYRRGC